MYYKLIIPVIFGVIINGAFAKGTSTTGNTTFNIVNGICLQIEDNDDKTYLEAGDTCASRNSKLLTINSTQFREALNTELDNTIGYWTSATYINGDYRWLNGTGNTVTPSSWKDGITPWYQPDQCVQTTHDFFIHLHTCSHQHEYICQKDPVLARYIYCEVDDPNSVNVVMGRNYSVRFTDANTPETIYNGHAIDGVQLCPSVSEENYTATEWKFDLGEQIFIQDIKVYIEEVNETEIIVSISTDVDANNSLVNAIECSRYNYNSTMAGLNVIPMACIEPVARYVTVKMYPPVNISYICEIEINGIECVTNFTYTCDDQVNTYIVLLYNESSTTTAATTEDVTTTESLLTTATCSCPTEAPSKNITVTMENVYQEIEKLVNELTVDAKKTNKALRKRISVEDPRPSAQAVGAVGIVMLIIIFGGFILFDIPRVIDFFVKIWRSFWAKYHQIEHGNGQLSEMKEKMYTISGCEHIYSSACTDVPTKQISVTEIDDCVVKAVKPRVVLISTEINPATP